MTEKPTTATDVVCIYHHPCNDGFTAAWIVWKYYQQYGIEVEFLQGSYSEEVPLDKCAGKDVIIVDYSYPAEDIEALSEIARNILVIDHHKTALPLLNGIFKGLLNDKEKYDPWPDNVKLFIKMEYSGAMLTWKYYFPEVVTPLLVMYVQDRDLWTKDIIGCDAIHAYLTSLPFEFSYWEQAREDLDDNITREACIKEGQAIQAWVTKWILSHINEASYLTMIEGYTIPCVNIPKIFASEAGHILLQGNNHPFSLCYYETIDTWYCSLRAEGDNIDVSKIAQKLGGGGHAKAAGFIIHKNVNRSIHAFLARHK